MIQTKRMHQHRFYSYFKLTVILVASYQTFECESFAPNVLRFRHLTGRKFPTKYQAPPPILAHERRNQSSKISRSVTLYSSSANVDQETETMPYIKHLFLLCRPINFPIVVMFHVLGVHEAARFWESTAAPSPTVHLPLLLPLLKHPSMLMVMLALLLVTSTSMLTNDYYDAKTGVDSAVSTNGTCSSENEHYHPLAKGELPFSVAKMFDSYLYAILLLTSAFVPGSASRLMVIVGAITTYLYTLSLKPRTWVKNLACAALVALSPVTSGLAAWHVLCEGSFLEKMGTGGVGICNTLPFYLIFKSPLSFLVVALFAGIMRCVTSDLHIVVCEHSFILISCPAVKF